jgi:hypothetical protein
LTINGRKELNGNTTDNQINKGINALYYPETICLDEVELKYLLLLYDRVFFLPVDIQLNPGHTTLTKRFSLNDMTLAGAFKSKKASLYASMYSSEPNVWDDKMKRLMDLYDELEEKGIVIGLTDEKIANPYELHPLKVAVDADMKDFYFVSTCQRYQKEKITISKIDNAKMKSGILLRPPIYKGNLSIPSICSERINTTLFIAGRDNLFPVCGQPMYVELLKTKLRRAASAPPEHTTPPNTAHRFSLLSWEIATEVVPQNIIKEKSIKELLRYKIACIDLKQKFRSYLWSLESSMSAEPWGENFSREIDIIIKKEVIPEVQRIQEQKIAIWEKLFGQTLKSLTSVKIAPVLVGIHLVAGLSFWEILALSTSIIGGATFKPIVDAWQEMRPIRRNALFFLIRLLGR